MRISHAFRCLLGNLIAISVVMCTLTTAFNLDLFARDLSNLLFKRSLPGSLATAPEGAIGYPPGPVAHELPPTKASSPNAYTTITTTITTYGVSHELKQLPTGSGNTSALRGPQMNYALVTATATKTEVSLAATQTAVASRDIMLGSAIPYLSILLAMWNL